MIKKTTNQQKISKCHAHWLINNTLWKGEREREREMIWAFLWDMFFCLLIMRVNLVNLKPWHLSIIFCNYIQRDAHLKNMVLWFVENSVQITIHFHSFDEYLHLDDDFTTTMPMGRLFGGSCNVRGNNLLLTWFVAHMWTSSSIPVNFFSVSFKVPRSCPSNVNSESNILGVSSSSSSSKIA